MRGKFLYRIDKDKIMFASRYALSLQTANDTGNIEFRAITGNRRVMCDRHMYTG